MDLLSSYPKRFVAVFRFARVLSRHTSIHHPSSGCRKEDRHNNETQRITEQQHLTFSFFFSICFGSFFVSCVQYRRIVTTERRSVHAGTFSAAGARPSTPVRVHPKVPPPPMFAWVEHSELPSGLSSAPPLPTTDHCSFIASYPLSIPLPFDTLVLLPGTSKKDVCFTFTPSF